MSTPTLRGLSGVYAEQRAKIEQPTNELQEAHGTAEELDAVIQGLVVERDGDRKQLAAVTKERDELKEAHRHYVPTAGTRTSDPGKGEQLKTRLEQSERKCEKLAEKVKYLEKHVDDTLNENWEAVAPFLEDAVKAELDTKNVEMEEQDARLEAQEARLKTQEAHLAQKAAELEDAKTQMDQQRTQLEQQTVQLTQQKAQLERQNA